ncbi:fungal-specific transcription factor domain-containing protein [Penicillium waksmanii]|uniref:fungal-specific transcription factor domain-containing protein n=1 Tax=Penicillium waksmanii TaxID=69791 RepID=UPI002549870D|nr:fungal-specific transcription factor domain-containing protein [Penicillium waksmanii]KAJ5984676.1 fungal-specific transcription factor domain-containing protein [Penicillium waksmanii]
MGFADTGEEVGLPKQHNEPPGIFRRSLNTSCLNCRKRKVKCDASEGRGCSSCERYAVECRPHPTQNQQRRSRKRQVYEAKRSHINEAGHKNNQPPTTSQDAISGPFAHFRTENLSKFFETGVLSSRWEGFEENGTVRNVYIGTDISNLYHLVRDYEPPDNNYISYPFPAIRDELPWKPHPELSGHHYLSSEALNDLSSLPIPSVRDALIDTYFNDIHPGCPIIDEADFRRRNADPENPPAVTVATSRGSITAVLFRRAKTLFELKHENDRVDLIQAAILLSSHVENSDNVASNAYSWIGDAVRTAFGMSLHRRASLRYVPSQRKGYHRKYKKIWWMLLHSEVLLALEHGRPCMIRPEDFDIGPLEDDDFSNMDDSQDQLVNRDFCCLLSETSIAALEVVHARAPRAQNTELGVTKIEQSLASIALKIPLCHDFWSCQLRITYSLVALSFHRTSQQLHAFKLCSEEASNILTTFEAMVMQDTIRQCHQSSTAALMGAAIQFSREVRAGIGEGSIMKSISAHGQLKRLLAPAKKLFPYFTQGETICRLCENLLIHAEAIIKDFQLQHLAHSTLHIPEEPNLNWVDIMTNYCMPDIDIGLETCGWSNDGP